MAFDRKFFKLRPFQKNSSYRTLTADRWRNKLVDTSFAETLRYEKIREQRFEDFTWFDDEEPSEKELPSLYEDLTGGYLTVDEGSNDETEKFEDEYVRIFEDEYVRILEEKYVEATNKLAITGRMYGKSWTYEVYEKALEKVRKLREERSYIIFCEQRIPVTGLKVTRQRDLNNDMFVFAIVEIGSVSLARLSPATRGILEIYESGEQLGQYYATVVSIELMRSSQDTVRVKFAYESALPEIAAESIYVTSNSNGQVASEITQEKVLEAMRSVQSASERMRVRFAQMYQGAPNPNVWVTRKNDEERDFGWKSFDESALSDRPQVPTETEKKNPLRKVVKKNMVRDLDF